MLCHINNLGKAGLLGLCFLLIPFLGQAQDNRFINTHSWQYEYIQRLQQRGYLLQLNPTDLPYTFKDIRNSLDRLSVSELSEVEKRWYRMLDESFKGRPTNIDSMRVGGGINTGARHSSSERLNVDDPLGEGEVILPRTEFLGYLEWKNWIGQAGLNFDWFYDIDPDGLDQARRLYMRSEETYFGYNGEKFDLHVGRFDNQWSLYDRQGAFLTDNPRSFDQIQLRFGSSKLSFSSILGELDNMSSDSTFTGRSFELGAVRRYLFLHRLDWSPLPNLKLSFVEGELYFSQTASIQMRNLLPLHFLFFESYNRPMNNNSNIMLGGSVWYQTGSLTLFFQVMIDDVDIKSQDGPNDPKHPLPFTVNSSITIADVAKQFDIGLEADLVGTNTYRSGRYQDQWTFAQRGIATNFSDYIRTKVYTTFYPNWMRGLKIEPALTLYWKGTEDLRGLRTPFELDGSPMPAILANTVERTLRPSLYLRYQPMSTTLFDPSKDIRFNFWVDADMGVNFVENYYNVEGVTDRRFIGLFRFFGEVTF